MQALQFGNNLRNAMKKFIYTLISLSIVAFAACNKIETAPKTTFEPGPAPDCFTVNVPGPQTKTVIEGVKVKWSVGDQIRVYGHNTSTGTYSDSGTYTLDTGDGSTSAVFAKDDPATLTGTYDEFYAVYPATRTLTITGSPLKMQLDKVSKTQAAVDNSIGFDPSFAVMTAAYDGAKLAFRHGAGYIKFVLTEDEVSSVAINLGSNCLVQQPKYLPSDGAYSEGGSGYATVTLTPAGGAKFVKGTVYYAPVFPRPDDSSKKISGLTVTCTGGSTYTTTHFDGLVVEYGKIFDIGTLSKVVPTSISSEDITGVAYAGVSTTHPVSFVNAVGWTPSIQSYTGCVSAASLASTDEITADPSAGTINYTVGAYDALVGNTGTIVVRLTKAGEDPIDKTINVTQNSSSGPVVNTYLLYVNSSKQLTRTKNGEAFDGYFNTGTGTSILDCEEGSYFGTATSYTINGDTYRYARKLDGSNPLSFTVTTGATATLKFYAARREETKTTTIKVKKDGSNVLAPELQWADGKAVLYESSVIDLVAGSTYTFEKSGDNIGIFYVEVVETIPAS